MYTLHQSKIHRVLQPNTQAQLDVSPPSSACSSDFELLKDISRTPGNIRFVQSVTVQAALLWIIRRRVWVLRYINDIIYLGCYACLSQATVNKVLSCCFQDVNLEEQLGTPGLFSHGFWKANTVSSGVVFLIYKLCLQIMEGRICFYWNALLAGGGHIVSFKVWEIPLVSQCGLELRESAWRYFV